MRYPTIEDVERRLDVEDVLRRVDLEPWERKMLEMRYGLYGNAPVGNKAIGLVIGCSPDTVARHLPKALRKLRRPDLQRLLRDYR